MTVRFYMLPIERNGLARGPKYFNWRNDPDPPALVTCTWALKDYGVIDYGLVCADVTSQNHTDLSAQSDVGAVPTTLDNTLTGGQVTAVQNRLEAIALPATWVTTALTWRQVLRSITGIMLYMQRVTALSGQSPFDTGATLSTQIGSISQQWRDWMQQAANDMAFDYSAVTGSTTVRQLLKMMADQFDERVISFGLIDL